MTQHHRAVTSDLTLKPEETTGAARLSACTAIASTEALSIDILQSAGSFIAAINYFAYVNISISLRIMCWSAPLASYHPIDTTMYSKFCTIPAVSRPHNTGRVFATSSPHHTKLSGNLPRYFLTFTSCREHLRSKQHLWWCLPCSSRQIGHLEKFPIKNGENTI